MWIQGLSAQTSTYWYADGLPDTWFYQPDIFAFRGINGSAFTGTTDSTIIDSIVYRSSRPDKAIEVFFKATATPTQKLDQITELWNSGQIEMPYLTLTRDFTAPRTDEKWYVIDNILLVNFTDPYPDSADLANFMGVLNLTPFQFPSATLPTLTQGPSYTYMFTVNPEPDGPPGTYYPAEYFAAVARDAFTSFNGLVANAEPNIVNHRIPYEGVPTTFGAASGTTTLATCPTNDPEYYHLNHIENTGTFNNIPNNQAGVQSPPLPTGVAGADAHICGCWNQGLSGAGVKVGIIGYEYWWINGNPDLAGRYDQNKLWDCSSGMCNPAYNDWMTYPQFYGSHCGQSQGLAQIIAANANTYGTVGVAPNVTLHAYELSTGNYLTGGGGTFSTAAAVSALNKALADLTDIVVLQWFADPTSPIATSPFIKAEINNLGVYGRNQKRTILIAPAGHWNSGTVGTNVPMSPANILGGPHTANVIGVIASNRMDVRCDFEDLTQSSSPYTYPTNYGSIYEIAAPGPALPYANKVPTQPNYAYLVYDYFPDIGAIGTVAGVAAMLLEQDPTLTENELNTLLKQGADKVGGYTYINGESEELGNGRINCENSLNLLTTAIEAEKTAEIKVHYTAVSWQIEVAHTPQIITSVQLYDMTGRLLNIYPVQHQVTEIPTNMLAKGMYILQLMGKNGQIGKSVKILNR